MVTEEPFVSAEEATKFLPITRRHLLALARKGIAGAYAVDPNAQRKVWVFRLSELAAAIVEKKQCAGAIPKEEKRGMIRSGSPR